ncbi:hypothetical protein I4U23_025441 [Adineta vaga]|nr:hypothetical protein I4U23_025441 [Adineta vaga]
MEAHVLGMDQRRKGGQSAEHDYRDGMSVSTKKHFDHVKRKMLAFVDRQHRRKKSDRAMQPPVPFHHKPNPVFPDQNRAPKPAMHHPTPLLLHKQQGMFPGHGAQKQLAHRGFATPQIPHRFGKGGVNMDGRIHPNVAFF